MSPVLGPSVLALALLIGAPIDSRAAPPPRTDRGGVPASNLLDNGSMGPPATPAQVQAADRAITVSLPAGPFKPEWTSIEAHDKAPA